MWNKYLVYFILVTAVTIGGEFQLYPGFEDFRISLGTPIFLFFLLWSRKIKPIPAGLLTSMAVIIFRSTLSIHNTPNITIIDAFLHHIPAGFYYVVYGLLFYLFKTRTFYKQPIIIALLGMIMEISSSIVEIFIRNFFSGVYFTLNVLSTIFIVSFFRSFFVLGFINFFLLQEARVTEELERKKNEKMLILVSELYVEMVQLSKSMKNAENTTRACYNLYQDLLKEKNDTYARKALNIAGEIHEIKKDHQRIYSSLARLKVREETTDLIKIDDIIKVIVESNRHYAKTLGKSIYFDVEISGEHPHYNSFILLSLMNNLITNSVEAIENNGIVFIKINRSGSNIEIHISDNGPGIPPQLIDLVFEPGYTTKYNHTGLPSNGIGLSHIKEVIEELKGNIELHSNESEPLTTFTIKLPVENINYSR